MTDESRRIEELESALAVGAAVALPIIVRVLMPTFDWIDRKLKIKGVSQ